MLGFPIGSILRRAYSLRPGPGTPWPLFFVGLRNVLFNRKKTLLLLAFLLLPAGVTLIVSDSLDSYTPGGDETTTARGGLAWFQDIHSALFFPLVLPIVTAVYATAAIGEEVDGKTLPYLFTRPIFRSWTLLARVLSNFLATAILGCIAITITWFLALGIEGEPFANLGQLFGYWSAVGLTVLGTGGVFLLLGVSIRPAVIIICVYTFVWETFLATVLPGDILKFSFVFYVRAYVNSFIGREAGFVQKLLIDIPSGTEAMFTLLLLGVLGFLASLLVVSWRDYDV